MIKFSTLVVCGSAMFMAASALANDVVLKMPSKTNVHVVNDSEVQRDSTTSSLINLNLHKGVNQVVFNYATDYRENGKEAYFASNELIATVNLKTDGIYRLLLPEIQSSFQANQFLKSPSMRVTDASGKNVPLLFDTLRESGDLLRGGVLKESRFYNLHKANKASVNIEFLNPKMESQDELFARIEYLMSLGNQETRSKIIKEFGV